MKRTVWLALLLAASICAWLPSAYGVKNEGPIKLSCRYKTKSIAVTASGADAVIKYEVDVTFTKGKPISELVWADAKFDVSNHEGNFITTISRVLEDIQPGRTFNLSGEHQVPGGSRFAGEHLFIKLRIENARIPTEQEVSGQSETPATAPPAVAAPPAAPQQKAALERQPPAEQSPEQTPAQPPPAKQAAVSDNQFRVVYDRLLSFKDEPQFHRVGFGKCCQYNRWLEYVKALQNRPNLSESEKQVCTDVILLGFEYMRSKGVQTPEAEKLNRSISQALAAIDGG